MIQGKMFIKTGSRHIRQQRFCQDSAAMSLREKSEIVIAAVSDGCSGARYSSTGSKLCAEGFVRAFDKMSDKAIKRLCSSGKYDTEIKKTVLFYLGEIVKNSGMEYYQISSTLVGILCCRKNALVVHIGDGFSIKLKNGHTDIVSPPENGAVTNITFFATSPDAEKHLRISRTTVNDGIIISTDGLSDTEINSSLFQFDRLHKLLSKETFSDDCGVILITRKNNI